MNKDNVLKVADAIEKHSIPDLGFNMGYWQGPDYGSFPDRTIHKCGTVACVGGWTDAVHAHEMGLPIDTFLGGAADYLELGEAQEHSLFFPPGWDNREQANHAARFSPAGAVAVLRHLAETGEVDWSVADKAAA